MAAAGDAGEVALVLHTHLPWLKGHGVWPVGEEWLFQAWGGSWLPVTDLLVRLADEGHRELLTLGVTPMVAHQVADRRLRAECGTWLAGQMWRAEEQRSLHRRLGPEVVELGTFHWRHYARLLEVWERVESAGGLLAVWSELAAAGVIELLGGPATHPYLPLGGQARLVDAQLTAGLDHHATWAGGRPRGLWPPELGYRPAGRVADPTATPSHVDRHGTPSLPRSGPDAPGLEEHYAAHGIEHVVVDAPTLVRAAGGRDRDWTRRPATAAPDRGEPDEVVHDGVLIGDSDVAAFARDLSVAYHVWSPTAGYPGDAWYLDYHARGSFGVHPSWRVTDRRLPPTEKAPYEPDAAAASVRRHVDHLHTVLREVLDPRPGGLVVAAYDTELFGHWWFEGVAWLEGLLRQVAGDPRLRTTTLASRRDRRPPTRRLSLPESSWGYAKGHASWVTSDTRWMWEALRGAEETFLARAPALPRDHAEQAARELALLASSDWPFMLTRGNSPDYAADRFRGHLARFRALCSGRAGPAEVSGWRQLDAAPGDPSAFLRVAGIS